MMKWKVVKNPRSASADRSLECLKSEAPQTDSNNNNNNSNSEQDALTSKENNKNAHQGRRSSKDCINLKSFLGLSRQRSESNLSALGLVSTEPRRSRSEVRGSSCDRLTIGYHTTPLKSLENRNFEGTEKGFKLDNNSKTRCSSPPRKTSCWLRGRKRERDSKGNADELGKTVVTGSDKKLGSKSKTNSSSSVTIVDGSDSKDKTKVCSSNNLRRSKFGKKIFDGEVIVEDVIYSDVDHENSRSPRDSKRETLKESNNKVVRKKGQAPKPQINTSLFKEDSSVTSTVSNSKKTDQVDRELKTSPCSKPPRKSLTFGGRNQDKKADTLNDQTVRCNNFRNSDNKSFCTDHSQANNHLVAIAEIHKTSQNGGVYKSVDAPASHVSDALEKNLHAKLNSFSNEPSFPEKEAIHEETTESAPFHIDTPDYSTLESEVGDSSRVVANHNAPDVRNHCEDSHQTKVEHETTSNENVKTPRVNSLSSILRDSSGEHKWSESEPKKCVRFEKMDLIEQYKKYKADSSFETEDDLEPSESELDSSSNEAIEDNPTTLDATESDVEPANSTPGSPTEKFCNGMMVNVLVRNATSEVHQESSMPVDVPQPQLVVKKSFVLTIAKQERGFRSLCANKKGSTENLKDDPHISVTFLCSAEPWPEQESRNTTLRLRSLSVPPPVETPPDAAAPSPVPPRSRSRERRCKDKQHCKKNHKVKKKDAVFHMPQAVIDELSQVLEKRKPSLDEIAA